MLIEVLPIKEEKKWGLYLDGELFGVAKNSFDCDYAARILTRIIDGVTINNHPELRPKIT
jgi:hypothetical protein